MKRLTFIKAFLLGLIARPGKAFGPAKIEDCHTSADVQGPFFRPGAPSRVDLAAGYAGEGDPLHVEGRVFGQDCQTALAGANIEVWHAGPDGQYDLSSGEYLFRGHLTTDEQGRYHFTTLVPKGYRDGPLDRPRHIHYIVKAKGHRTLVTQLYFQGDEKLKDDIFVQQNNGLQRAKAMQTHPDGGFQMIFDISLRGE